MTIPLRLAPLLSVGFFACGGSSTPSTSSDPDAKVIALAIDAPMEVISIAPNSREGEVPPESFALSDWTKDRFGRWTRPNPIRVRNLYFFKAPPGMELRRPDGTVIPHKYVASASEPHWIYDKKTLSLVNFGEESPDGILFSYPKATERERALNLDAGEATAEEFVRTSVQAGAESRSGLLLPAPSHVKWTVKVPPAADLRFAPSLVAPEILTGEPSDGATLTITLEDSAGRQTLWSERWTSDAFEEVSIDLAKWAGQTVTLHMETADEGSTRFDYLFVADPRLSSRKTNPRKVVMVFVDTLRPDHLDVYGYERETAPALAALAKNAVVYENTRNVAPWTLPSTRSVLTGMDPEYYFSTPTLQGRMREAGFITAMFAGNMYLGPAFGINRDWGLHFVELLPHAEDQVDRAVAWLDDHQQEDTFMMLHLMDVHLPYKEPESYRSMFAGDRPEIFKKDVFHRGDVVRARPKPGPQQDYVRGRYDNNIRYVDDQLQRIFERLDDNDILVYFSDHGEEFWEHGGFEHGHTLYDEVLRVPLVIKAPQFKGARRVSAPTSLLDVAPTVLDLVGLPFDDLKGTSLVAASGGNAEALKALDDRGQAFGRPLYGAEQWGVLADDQKFITSEGTNRLFDLTTDPQERRNLALRRPEAVSAARDELSATLERTVVDALRVSNRSIRQVPRQPLVLDLTIPGGIANAWVGADPTEASQASIQWVPGEETIQITWPAGFRGRRDVLVVPNLGIESTSANLTGTLRAGEQSGDVLVKTGDKPAKLRRPSYATATVEESPGRKRYVEIGLATMPVPPSGGTALSGLDPEIEASLKAMGYLDEEE